MKLNWSNICRLIPGGREMNKNDSSVLLELCIRIASEMTFDCSGNCVIYDTDLVDDFTSKILEIQRNE